MRNYEGYYDPTAGKAIHEVMCKTTMKGRKPPKSKHLYYKLGNLYCFKMAYKMLEG